MKITKYKKYNLQLKNILSYIAKTNPKNAQYFKKELDEKILSLPHMPYKYRKSIYFDDENIRDLVFKGYTIPYLIDENKKSIVLLGIIKYKEKF